jgi:hypothetical protein
MQSSTERSLIALSSEGVPVVEEGVPAGLDLTGIVRKISLLIEA